MSSADYLHNKNPIYTIKIQFICIFDPCLLPQYFICACQNCANANYIFNYVKITPYCFLRLCKQKLYASSLNAIYVIINMICSSRWNLKLNKIKLFSPEINPKNLCEYFYHTVLKPLISIIKYYNFLIIIRYFLYEIRINVLSCVIIIVVNNFAYLFHFVYFYFANLDLTIKRPPP